jgi:hypothetical protein
MYNEQTNAHLTDSLLRCSVFIAPTCFNVNAWSSGSSHSLPAKLHKRVDAAMVVLRMPGRHSGNISTQTVYTATWEKFPRIVTTI